MVSVYATLCALLALWVAWVISPPENAGLVLIGLAVCMSAAAVAAAVLDCCDELKRLGRRADTEDHDR